MTKPAWLRKRMQKEREKKDVLGQYKLPRAPIITSGERSLAKALKHEKINFRQQAQIAGQLVDFVIGKTVIEIEGRSHYSPQAKERDMQRMEKLERAGYTVLRFSEGAAQTDPKGMVKTIKKLIKRS